MTIERKTRVKLEFDKVSESIIDIFLEKKKIRHYFSKSELQPILDKEFCINKKIRGTQNIERNQL